MSDAAAVPRPPRAVTAVSAWLTALGGTSVIGAVIYAAGWVTLEQHARLLGVPLVTAQPAEIMAAGSWDTIETSVLSLLHAVWSPGVVPVAWLALAICLCWCGWRARGGRGSARFSLAWRTLLVATLAATQCVLLYKISRPLLDCDGLLLQGAPLASICQTHRTGLRYATGGTTNLGDLLQVELDGSQTGHRSGLPQPVHRLLATCLLLLVATALWSGEFFTCLRGWRRRGFAWPLLCIAAGLFTIFVLLGAVKYYLGLLGVVARPFEHKTCLVDLAPTGAKPEVVEHVYLGDAGPYHFFVDCSTGALVSFDKAPRKIVWRASAHVLSVAMQARQRSLPTTRIPPTL